MDHLQFLFVGAIPSNTNANQLQQIPNNQTIRTMETNLPARTMTRYQPPQQQSSHPAVDTNHV